MNSPIAQEFKTKLCAFLETVIHSEISSGFEVLAPVQSSRVQGSIAVLSAMATSDAVALLTKNLRRSLLEANSERDPELTRFFEGADAAASKLSNAHMIGITAGQPKKRAAFEEAWRKMGSANRFFPNVEPVHVLDKRLFRKLVKERLPAVAGPISDARPVLTCVQNFGAIRLSTSVEFHIQNGCRLIQTVRLPDEQGTVMFIGLLRTLGVDVLELWDLIELGQEESAADSLCCVAGVIPRFLADY